jgi:hypothetical protein
MKCSDICILHRRCGGGDGSDGDGSDGGDGIIYTEHYININFIL